MHPLNIRRPDVYYGVQIWENDTCIGLRCENVRVNHGPGYIVSGVVMVGEVYHTLGSSTSRLVIRRVIDAELLETKDLDTGRPGRCSISFLLCPYTCRRVS